MIRGYANKADKNTAEFILAYNQAIFSALLSPVLQLAMMSPKLNVFFFNSTERKITSKNFYVVLPALAFLAVAGVFGAIIGGLFAAPSKFVQAAGYLGHLISAAVQGKKARSWSQFWTTEADPAPTAPVVDNVAVDAEREEAIRQAVEVPIADTLVTAFRNTPTPPAIDSIAEFPALSVAADTPVATRRQKQGGN